MPDFSLKDLSFPTPERTRLILSAFINLVKFSEQQADFVTALRGKSAKLVEEREKVGHELARVQAQLELIKCVLCISTFLCCNTDGLKH